MKKSVVALIILLMNCAAAFAQNVTVIGPITPGDIPQFNSTTVIKDSGLSAASVPTGLANPSASVGLTAVNGSATTAMRSDAAPPLSSSVQSALTGTNGNLLVGTGAFGFSAIVMSGDCTWSSPNITCTKTSGVTFSNYATAPITTVTTNTTLSSANFTVLCDATSGAVSITLPAVPSAGLIFKVKKIDSSVNACTIAAASGNIDNLASISITSRYTSYTFQANSSQWWVF